jgi:nitroimidazol reductase NimA-like FMN-containing flavoprotein (pyridoxamine 5'-phosphate oxidase superfamily)
MEVDRNGLEVLDRAECLRLLGSCTFGRIALTFGALPTVLPVNFRLVGDKIVFRTGVGSKLDAATCGNVVAFEVDHVDPMEHGGWSVVATGTATEVTDPAELDALRQAGIPRWAPGGEDRIVQLPTVLLSGRRLRAGSARLSS